MQVCKLAKDRRGRRLSLSHRALQCSPLRGAALIKGDPPGIIRIKWVTPRKKREIAHASRPSVTARSLSNRLAGNLTCPLKLIVALLRKNQLQPQRRRINKRSQSIL